MRIAFVIVLFLLPMLPTYLAIRDVVYRKFEDPQKKLYWLLFLIFVPFVGGLIYFVFKKSGKSTDKIP